VSGQLTEYRLKLGMGDATEVQVAPPSVVLQIAPPVA